MKRSLGLLAIDLVADRDLDLQGILDRDIESEAFLYKVLFKYPNASRSLSRGEEPRGPFPKLSRPSSKVLLIEAIAEIRARQPLSASDIEIRRAPGRFHESSPSLRGHVSAYIGRVMNKSLQRRV